MVTMLVVYSIFDANCVQIIKDERYVSLAELKSISFVEDNRPQSLIRCSKIWKTKHLNILNFVWFSFIQKSLSSLFYVYAFTAPCKYHQYRFCGESKNTCAHTHEYCSIVLRIWDIIALNVVVFSSSFGDDDTFATCACR